MMMCTSISCTAFILTQEVKPTALIRGELSHVSTPKRTIPDLD